MFTVVAIKNSGTIQSTDGLADNAAVGEHIAKLTRESAVTDYLNHYCKFVVIGVTSGVLLLEAIRHGQPPREIIDIDWNGRTWV